MASRFWVGGTGTWDASDTTHWAATSNGAGGASVPGSGDTVTLDGSSGGGTVTVNTTVTVQSITCGAFTGTLDFSANNNNVTLSANTGFSGTGSGTRAINLGNGTWTLSGTGNATIWDMATTTNLTFSANSSSIVLSGNAAGGTSRGFAGGALTYATVTINGASSGGSVAVTGANTFSTLTATGPIMVTMGANMTFTNLNLSGTSSGQVGFQSSNISLQRTLTITALTADWVAFRAIIGSGTATNSFDLGNNSGITITVPASGGRNVLINNPSLVA
jgi:hypothetical protein